MLLALLACVGLQTPPSYSQIQARVPKSPWVVSVGLADWKEAPAGTSLMKPLGDKLVLNGTCAPAGTRLTLIAEPNTELISPAAWRKRFAVPGREFECQLSACVDASSRVEGGPTYSVYNAYTCAAGYCFDLHVSRLVENEKEELPREEFERIVRSMQVLLLRRGWAEDYPDAVGQQMTLAALAGPGRTGWKEKYLPKHAEEWTAQFVEAEFLRFEKAPVEQQIACYEKSLALLAKLEKPGPKERFGWAIVCDGLSLALYDGKRVADSIAPLEKGYGLLAELARKERAPLAYNLACAQALGKNEQQALAALANAIAADPRYRESAAKDEDFALLRASPEFQKLLAKPPPAPAK